MFAVSATALKLPLRFASKPRTTSQLPHSQLDQHGPDKVVNKLHKYCFSLPDVNNEHSGISVPGARALVMQHNAYNGSMHVKLNAKDAKHVIAQGWGEDHYLETQGFYPKGLIMTFSPRDNEELEEIKKIVAKSYEYATRGYCLRPRDIKHLHNRMWI